MMLLAALLTAKKVIEFYIEYLYYFGPARKGLNSKSYGFSWEKIRSFALLIGRLPC